MQYHGYIWTGLFVEDLDACVAFYKDVLGLPLIRKRSDTAHFDAGNGALFELMSGGKASHRPKDPEQQPIVVGLRVDDLEKALSELKQKGVLFIGEPGEYKGTRWVQFSDPEGNRLEIKQVPSTS
jgi:predicted enzyme related to lactoylglutathione lyase